MPITNIYKIPLLIANKYYPSASNLFKRAILMSGSSLSPWAIVKNSSEIADNISHQLGCPLAPSPQTHKKLSFFLHCLRNKTVDQLLEVRIEIFYKVKS